MTDAIFNEQNLICKNILQLFSQLNNVYQNALSERQEIIIEFPPEDEEFSLLEEIELLTVNLRGYASQIQSTRQITNKAQAIAHLQSMRIFNVAQIARFYFNSNGKYEQMKNYLRILDYLRLLMLEYLQLQKI
ncbi:MULTISPECIES: hypothetical protein [Calothrix]|uniref:Heterocyst frequency control protein PatD n=2 Tax=Calothrix TaxID=1186 RepID=A0ABR8A835_9CYAN|nr:MULTISPECIES: hypothetical protein [Calothrix]MBD2195206.1 hypothetical protein [Calothrix parietina FACHB-288]MBD2223823.1 hypothetical protein [Calothrix anomala FACHB-343]